MNIDDVRDLGQAVYYGNTLAAWTKATLTFALRVIVILLLTTLYVYFLIFTQLAGFIRAGTAIGLAAVLFVVAWLARTYPPGPKPTDLVNVKPGARRERRYGRRQRSQ